MFIPNVQVKIWVRGGYDLYGKADYVTPTSNTPACVVKIPLKVRKTSVRADSSASRGAAKEVEADTRFLLPPTTAVKDGDLVEFNGTKFQIAALHQRYDVFGRFDHIQVDAGAWAA